MKKTHYLLSMMAVAAMLMSGCNKTDNPEPEATGIEKLSVPNGFTFETSALRSIEIIFPDAIQLGDIKSRIDIFTQAPSNGGKLLYSGSAAADNTTSIDLMVPVHLNQLFVQTQAGSALVELNSGAAKAGEIVINFNDGTGFLPPPVAEETKTTSINTTNTIHYKSVGSIVNLISNGGFDDDDFGLIADWPSPMVADGKWYITSTLGTAHAKQQTQAGETFLRKTSSPAKYGGVAQLIAVSPGDLITFTADVRLTGNSRNISWLFLIPRDAAGNSLNYFSIQTNPSGEDWVTRTVAATMPANAVSVQVLLWSHVYGGRVDYDNVIVTGPVSDSDGDGVDDELDDYPNDADRAFNVYYPNADDFGTLAFEDLWPGKGDYDFNDLVVDYQFKQVLNGNNQLVEFFLDYQVRAIGATLENGFGIEIPGIDPDNIASITGQEITESYLNLNTNGTEQGQSNAVIILFDNAFSKMEVPAGSFGVNTTPDAPYVEPVMEQLHVLLVDPISTQFTGFAPYNPFLIVDKTRGREVHLPGKTPTDLHDPAYFGQWFDNSNPSTGKYYQSAGNLPWAINLPTEFAYPIEKADITSAYLKFGAWAESGGSSFTDWYINQGADYRNEAAIYSHE